MTQLTELQKTQAAYAHFTLEEWKLLARCLRHAEATLEGTREPVPLGMFNNILCKFPSAVL